MESRKHLTNVVIGSRCSQRTPALELSITRLEDMPPIVVAFLASAALTAYRKLVDGQPVKVLLDKRVRNDSPMRVDEAVEAGEPGGETRNSTGHEEIWAATNRMKQATMREISAKEKEVEDEIESRVGTITDTDADSECSSTLGEFPSLESLCEEDEELEQMENSIEQKNTSEKAVQEKVEDEIEVESREYEYEYEYEDSECSSSLREFLMLERLCEEAVQAEAEAEKNRNVEAKERKMEDERGLCEEYKEAKQKRRERRDQEKLEREFKRFRGGQLSTIEEVEEQEEEEKEEDEDSSVREIGEECEHSDECHREVDKYVASGDGDHIKGEKLMSLEEFCGETFAISPTFIEDIMEENRISQRRLEQAHEEFEKSLRLFPRFNEVARANPSDLQQLISSHLIFRSLLDCPPLRLLLPSIPENDLKMYKI
ncbi:unnamed protein product [Rodentolepis nana]|uniref:Uncharacterized protein n=1 Tax=Rodentolepis nana TaxID=102285 RepID=A0A0R3TCH1_RODNA|nr:unnamed protein product [Rodentolepis nana]